MAWQAATSVGRVALGVAVCEPSVVTSLRTPRPLECYSHSKKLSHFFQIFFGPAENHLLRLILRRSMPSSSIANSLAFNSTLAVSARTAGRRNVPSSSRLYQMQ